MALTEERVFDACRTLLLPLGAPARRNVLELLLVACGGSAAAALPSVTRAIQDIATERSHPQLRALDALVASGLSYGGWREDVARAEDLHARNPIMVDGRLQIMRRKQTMHAASNPAAGPGEQALRLHRAAAEENAAASAACMRSVLRSVLPRARGVWSTVRPVLRVAL